MTKTVQLDEILVQLGQFGKFQRRQYFLVCLPAILCAAYNGASVFLAGTPEFRCELPSHAFNGTDTFEVQDEAHNSSIQAFIPSVGGRLESCKIKHFPSAGRQETNFFNVTSGAAENVSDCESFVFSQKVFRATIVTEWGLVCSEKVKTTLSTMSYMAGVLVGSFVYGMISDFFGRRKCLLVAILIQGISGLSLAFAPEYYSYIALRFLNASANMGVYMTSFVIGMELIGPKYRLIAGILINYFFATGFIVISGVAYLTRRWNHMQIAISIPSFLLLSYYWLLTESPRWLMSKGRLDESEEIIRKAAKVNGVELSKSVFQSSEVKTGPQETITALLRARRLLFRATVLFFNWLAIALCYYGLSLNSGSIGGDIYLNFALGGLAEFPAYAVCFLCNKLGRKPVHVCGMLVGGVACIGTVLVDQFMRGASESTLNTYFVALNMVGKFGVTIGYCLIYIWSAELTPTALRNSMMGLCSLLGKIGSIAAPFIADMGNYVPPEYKRALPASLFSGFVIMAGLLSILLPETAGQKLPETVTEANIFPRVERKQGKFGEEEVKMEEP